MTTTGSGSVSNSAVCFLQMLCEQKDGSLQILLHGHPRLAVPAPAPIAPHGSTRSASLLQVWATGQTEAGSTGRSSSCNVEYWGYRLWIRLISGGKLFFLHSISLALVLWNLSETKKHDFHFELHALFSLSSAVETVFHVEIRRMYRGSLSLFLCWLSTLHPHYCRHFRLESFSSRRKVDSSGVFCSTIK